MDNKVLIIDDDRDLLNILRDFFVNDGFKAETAETGQEAYEKFYTFNPSLIILDIMLPDDDGIEICRNIRSESDIPIIMLSAKNEDISKILSLGLGADKYMTKPYSPTVVVAESKAILRRYRRQNKNHEIVGFNHLIIDKKKRKVKFYDTCIDFIGKEFDMFEFLVRNEGEVFSKEQLYDAIWGEDEFGELSTVSVHICRIRNKLEEVNKEHKLIKTVWGIGYKLEY